VAARSTLAARAPAPCRRDHRGQHAGLQLSGQAAHATRGHRRQRSGIQPAALLTGVTSGDYVQFKSTGPGYTLLVEGAGCNADKIEVPPFGGGLSPDLICTATGSNSPVTVSVSGFTLPVLQITVTPPSYTADAQALFVDEFSPSRIGRTIVVHRQVSTAMFVRRTCDHCLPGR